MEKELVCITIIVSLYLLVVGYFLIKGIIILTNSIKNKPTTEQENQNRVKFFILPNKTLDDLNKQEAAGLALFFGLLLLNLISR